MQIFKSSTSRGSSRHFYLLLHFHRLLELLHAGWSAAAVQLLVFTAAIATTPATATADTETSYTALTATATAATTATASTPATFANTATATRPDPPIELLPLWSSHAGSYRNAARPIHCQCHTAASGPNRTDIGYVCFNFSSVFGFSVSYEL